jgi:hypothetical protein
MLGNIMYLEVIEYEHTEIAKEKARYAVKKACKEGILIRPIECQICFNQYNSYNIIHAHHHWGYRKENRLRLIWLCPSCHALCHKQNH